MGVVAEHIVLPQPEARAGQPGQPLEEGIPTTDLAGARVATRDVPHDIGVDELGGRREVARSEGIRRPAVGGRVRMLGHRLVAHSGPR